jgi:hypothetical protein
MQAKDKVIMATGPGDGNIINISSQWLKEQMTQYLSSLLQRRGQSVLTKQIVATYHMWWGERRGTSAWTTLS